MELIYTTEEVLLGIFYCNVCIVALAIAGIITKWYQLWRGKYEFK